MHFYNMYYGNFIQESVTSSDLINIKYLLCYGISLLLSRLHFKVTFLTYSEIEGGPFASQKVIIKPMIEPIFVITGYERDKSSPD